MIVPFSRQSRDALKAQVTVPKDYIIMFDIPAYEELVCTLLRTTTTCHSLTVTSKLASDRETSCAWNISLLD